MIGAEFRYKTREKVREAEALLAKQQQAIRIIVYETVALILGLIIGSVVVYILMRRIQKAKQEREEQQRIIEEILRNQQMLNKNIQLDDDADPDADSDADSDADNPSPDVVSDLPINEDSTEKAINLEELYLISSVDEERFRRAFSKLYPRFLSGLRKDFPAITSNDELICMLIYLGIPAIDIAMSIGISRASLNSARYRIRKKFSLDKNTDLDCFIRSRKI